MLLLITLACFLSNINSMTFNFERTIIFNDSTEVVTGTVYFDPEGRSVVEVQSPILQYMLFEKNNWKVYYPQKNYAYSFKSNKTSQVPFVEILYSCLKEDFGLVQAGYQLDRYNVNNDSIVTYWSNLKLHPDQKIKLLQIKEKFISFELIHKDTTRVKTNLLNHYLYKDKFIPTEIYSEIVPGFIDKTRGLKERIKIFYLRINEPFPENILKFNIPPKIEIKEL